MAVNKNLLNYDYFAVPSHSTTSVGTTSVKIANSNQSRTYLFIQNMGGSNVFLALGTASKASAGILISAGSAYEMLKGNVYDGEVYAIAAAANIIVAVTDGYGM